MDIQGEGARKLLTALAESNDKLRTFAYGIYLRHKGSRWKLHFMISGTPFLNHMGQNKEAYERCFGPFVSFQLSSTISVEFSVSLYWDHEVWMVDAAIDVYDEAAEDVDYYKCLWQLPRRRTPDLDEAIVWLADATQQVINEGQAYDFSRFTPQPEA